MEGVKRRPPPQPQQSVIADSSDTASSLLSTTTAAAGKAKRSRTSSSAAATMTATTTIRGGGNSSSSSNNKVLILISIFLVLVVATILSAQVVWLRSNSNSGSKKTTLLQGDRQSFQAPKTTKLKKLVPTPPFDSSKLEQKRQQRLEEEAKRQKEEDGALKSQQQQQQQPIVKNKISPPQPQPPQSVSHNIAVNDNEKQMPPPSDGVLPKPPSLTDLPQWVQDYLMWHAQQRQLHPGMHIMDSPSAPKLLIRTCLGICGGLHDRIGQLPWDLYLAAKTKRLLLIAWQRPKEMEHFLLPNELPRGDGHQPDRIVLDWTVPKEAHFGFEDIKTVRNYTQLFEGYPEDHPDDEFWRTHVDLALERASSGEFAGVRILRHRLLGHLNEGILEERLEKEGWYENDKLHLPAQLHVAPTFGNIFHLFFRPSPAVHDEIKTVLETLELTPNQYMAVHCRVRHPKAHEAGSVVKGKNDNYPADKTGLPWEEGHPLREFACQTAATALECAREIGQQQDTISGSSSGGAAHAGSLPVYFLADSNDLVRHVSLELQDSNGYLKTKQTGIYQPLLTEVQAAPQRRIVARDVTLENAHIDRQKGRDPPAYFGTFIDLYVAMQAKCVVYGIGYYAAFAAKISGTTCSYLYAQEAWGSQVSKQAHICPNTAH